MGLCQAESVELNNVNVRASQQVHGASRKPHDLQAPKVSAHRGIPTAGLSCSVYPNRMFSLVVKKHFTAIKMESIYSH